MSPIEALLDCIEIGEPITAGALSMFPLLMTKGQTPPENLVQEPLTLDEALAMGLVIEEVSDSGSVPELWATNTIARPVFLLDGEQVIGLKQNRTFNISLLLPPNSKTTVPVSCLERGRWSSRHAPVRSAEHVHFASGRKEKMRSVSESVARSGTFRSDQSQVWHDIDMKMRDAASPTSAEADLHDRRREEIGRARDALVPQPGQCGAVFGVGSRVTGLDAFGWPGIYPKLHDKLVRSVLLDLVEQRPPAHPPSVDVVRDLIAKVLAATPSITPSPGWGQAYRWQGSSGIAAALVDASECVHLSAFVD